MLADAKLGDPARTDELFPAYDPTMPVITPSGLKGSGGAGATARRRRRRTVVGRRPAAAARRAPSTGDAGRLARRRRRRRHGSSRLAGLDGADGIAGDHQVGSNNWVVGPSKTATKTALLANDPHLGIGDAVGLVHERAALPDGHRGVPVRRRRRVVPGRSGRRSSATTRRSRGARRTSIPTSRTCSRSSPIRRTRPTTSSPASRSRSRSATRRSRSPAAPDVELDVRTTRDGPIVNDVDSRLKDAPLARPALDRHRRRRRHVRGDLPASTPRRTSTSSRPRSRRTARRRRTSSTPTSTGHIGYVLPGRIPIRADPNDHGDRIRSGSDGQHEWTGTIPFDGPAVAARPAERDDRDREQRRGRRERTRTSSPRSGIPGYRAKRITELLDAAAGDGGVSTDDAAGDPDRHASLRAELVVPFDRPGASRRPATARSLEQRIVDVATARLPDRRTASLGCAAYLAFEYRLVRGLVRRRARRRWPASTSAAARRGRR